MLIVLVACEEGHRGGFGDERGIDVKARLTALEHRAERIRDVSDIKRLQRAYGYYVDKMLWDEAADLFAEDARIELGLDGVYVGRARVLEYLTALGGGQAGLREGQLNEHMQLMPVITLAPDGHSARGRWRGLLMVGGLEDEARWGEGPYENEYIKEDGVWKIKSLHWFQSVLVPYATGWKESDDANGGRWVSDALPPDEPPSVDYGTWPETYLPPFHFENPVTSATASESEALRRGDHDESDVPSNVGERAAALEYELASLEDEDAIENLQRTYGFYVDKGFWSEAADLFAGDGTIEIGNGGVYVGREHVRAFLMAQGPEFPQEARLSDRMQLQPIVHVAADGQSARGRFRLFAQEAIWQQSATWSTGVYENEYVKEDGVWKIQHLHLYNTVRTPYGDGWGVTALPNNEPLTDPAPDMPPSERHGIYPEVFVPPFHYENPVSGAQATKEQKEQAPSARSTPPSGRELEPLVTELQARVERLEAIDHVERMISIYGYYLARNQWDDLAGLFASDGSIEIALRGVYVGSESIRRSLELYGESGIHTGLLHNHMQLQPLIHLSEDGASARVRSRAFSIMGQQGAYAMWMGGVYENELVKEGGTWKLHRDHLYNTYFAPYDVGWKDAMPRPPPGASEEIPPDMPPTETFEMYPAAHLPPYHYANPVTGNAVTWPD